MLVSKPRLWTQLIAQCEIGPNAMTFIIPGECFPTRYRSTCHGISAASGKLGAVLAQSLTGPLRSRGAVQGDGDSSPWLPHVIQM
jgi:PHS family inorganic phosphate transporter-like MFS transporter